MTSHSELAERLRKGKSLPDWLLKMITPDMWEGLKGLTFISKADATEAANALDSSIQVDEAGRREEIFDAIISSPIYRNGGITRCDAKDLATDIAANTRRLVTVDDGWRGIETHPLLDLKDDIQRPPDCLLYREGWGAYIGRVYRYENSSDIVSCVPHINGNFEATHWRHLPNPPQAALGKEGK